MFRIKQEPDALDLTNRPQCLLSSASVHDDEEENFSGEDELTDCLRKVNPTDERKTFTAMDSF